MRMYYLRGYSWFSVFSIACVHPQSTQTISVFNFRVEMENLTKRIQTELLAMEEVGVVMEKQKEEVVSQSLSQKEEIMKHFTETVKRLEIARDALTVQVDEQTEKRNSALELRAVNLVKSKNVLMAELSKIEETVEDDEKLDKFEVRSLINSYIIQFFQLLTICLQVTEAFKRVEPCLDGALIDIEEEYLKYFPTFKPASTFTKVKKSDFGFLQLGEHLPSEFSVAMDSSVIQPGDSGSFTVKTTGRFTPLTQANVEFRYVLVVVSHVSVA